MIGTLFLIASASAATFTADTIAADNVTKAAVATGHVVAKQGVVTLRSDRLERSEDGTMHFDASTCVTTCSNEVGHTHWNVTGEVEYRQNDYVLLRNAWLRFFEVPIFWLPYMYYPLDTKCGFSWMAGYMSRWGGYLMTKYRYHLIGDRTHQDNTWWVKGDTRFDVRTKNGVAFGEDLEWNLGDYGAGTFNIYYAWDEDYDRNLRRNGWRNGNWGSDVDRDRYKMTLQHKWNITERDILRVRGTYLSDSYFQSDFFRDSFFTLQNKFASYSNNGVFWEHNENSLAFGAEVSGRLNDFYAMTERLPEIYFDIAPQPIFDLPLNYESDNHAGWLRRRYAEYSAGESSAFGITPGLWADYETFRFDTYHRLTAPFKTFDDVVSVVPRVGYHGTFWNHGGVNDLIGDTRARSSDGNIYRSIIEGGVTFAARGEGMVDEHTKHMFEPYLDVLAQEALYRGLEHNARPYVFDAIDASRCWEDQLAGRGRNLPYSYYGFTPGLRNVWSKIDEKGVERQMLDVDIYAAVQLNERDWNHADEGLDDDSHGLADAESPNYGDGRPFVSPGARVRWTPVDDIRLGARGEYDSDRNRMAVGSFIFEHRVQKDFKYFCQYYYSDTRYWDFSSTPHSDNPDYDSDKLNWSKINEIHGGFTYQPIDWFAFSPFIRWDVREGELDAAGAWFDYLTDCLGFRFTVEYEESYTRIDGSKYDEDWNFAFQIYLRAFGFGSDSFFGNR